MSLAVVGGHHAGFRGHCAEAGRCDPAAAAGDDVCTLTAAVNTTEERSAPSRFGSTT